MSRWVDDLRDGELDEGWMKGRWVDEGYCGRMG